MKKQVLVPVADGTEDLEAVAIIDILRRAGAEVTFASVTDQIEVRCSQGIKMSADVLISQCRDREYDLVVLPGGFPGVEHLRDSEVLVEILKAQDKQKKLFGAICAAPAVVLAHHGLLDNRNATCHPGVADKLAKRDTTQAKVVVDGNCITSRGAGTAVDFALVLVETLFGKEKRQTVATGLAMVKQ
ncbi:MAG: DJ-1 family glyoxalase III [Thermodesulfobacteriota bacterium]|nr:DJ-1 family glyoxalase III [Thermodesulfobacteriota bacterium]